MNGWTSYPTSPSEMHNMPWYHWIVQTQRASARGRAGVIPLRICPLCFISRDNIPAATLVSVW